MSELKNSVVNYHAYNVHEGETLQTQVARVTGIILPRGFIAAGFSDRGDLLMIRHCDYPKDLPEWVPDFFDHRFAEEPLLSRPELVTEVVVMTEKCMLIPHNMYDETSAGLWLRKVFFIEENEAATAYFVQEENADYVYAWPAAIKGLVNRYFINARLLPLAAYQMMPLYKAENAIQCCITDYQVMATCYQNKKLQWHQVFPFTNAEEIAYKFHLLYKTHKLKADDVTVFYTATHSGINSLVDDLSQYIPNLRPSEAGVMVTDPQWASTVSLFQRLVTCAS